MSLFYELYKILFNTIDSTNTTRNDAVDESLNNGPPDDTILSSLLIKWCERIEEQIIQNPTREQQTSDSSNDNKEMIQKVSNKLLLLFLQVISEFLIQSNSVTTSSMLSTVNNDNFNFLDLAEIHIKEQATKIIISTLKNDDTICSNVPTKNTIVVAATIRTCNYLDVILRTSQNFIRWYIQFYDPSIQSTTSSTNYIRFWKHQAVLELYYRLIVLLSIKYPSYGRYVCQIFFYTTYCPTEDVDLTSSYEYLCSTCNLLQGLLQVLVQTKYETKVQLSLTKIVHNSLVSFPSVVTSTTIHSVSIPIPNNNVSDWVTTTNDSTISIRSVLWDLLRLYVRPRATNSTDDTPSTISIFPGPNDSRQSELVMEILRVFYAMKIGSTTLSNECDYEAIIIDIFRLNGSDPQCYECQLCCLQLLMDIPTEFGLSIIRSNYNEADDSNDNTPNSFFYLLDQQLTQLIEQSQGMIRNDIVASLTVSTIPILVCLNKYCKADDTVRAIVYKYVFPYSETYNELATTELHNSPNGTPKNMKPFDTPTNTIRWKLIQAMVWPYHNIIKRFAGELLWTLCNEDSNEFILRTGLGNALPYLGMKGLANVPLS